MIDYSIIIPAYNEEKYLPETLKSVKKAMSFVELSGEVVVVDNNSTDKSAEIAKSYGASVVFEAHNQISRARNRGARAAKGKYLIFLDADTLMPPELLKRSLDNLMNKNYCGGGVTIDFDTPQDKFITAFKSLWNYVSVKRSLAAGSYIYVSKECYDATGGFNEDIYASEEIWFSKKCKKWGKKNGKMFKVINDIKIITSGRKMEMFSTFQLYSAMVFFMLFPFAIKFKSLCFIWYKKRNNLEKKI
jgi:glycosyltransferase involved in cell wall biosynthesis